MKFNFYVPTNIVFGPGSLNKISKLSLPGKKALIVTGGTSTTKLGFVERLQENLLNNKSQIESVVYKDVSPNPTITNVNQCIELLNEHHCDFIIGIGGGSSIDTAKAVAVVGANGGNYWDYVHGGTGGGNKMKSDPLPVVAIATTAGTGTEADPWMVITNEETNEKIGIGNNKTFPKLSIVDPELMLSIPPQMTAFQGFDALFHAIEGYISKVGTPMSDMYALKSMQLIFNNLETAVKDGANLEARTNVAFASTLSGIVEAISSCTSEHSIEHALSAYHSNLPHGAGLIMISLEYFNRFLDVCPDKFKEMALVMGGDSSSQPKDFITFLTNLQCACNVDKLKMSDYGITKDKFSDYAENAMATAGALFSCDRTELTKDDVIDILEKSYK